MAVTCSAAAQQGGPDAALQWRLGVLPAHQRLMVLLLCSRMNVGSDTAALEPLHFMSLH